MKKILLLLIALLPLGAMAQNKNTDSARNASGLPVGALAPDFSLTDTAGRMVNFTLFRGSSYTVMEFWASWCPDCRRDTEKVKHFYNAWKSKGVKLMAISFDNDANAWRDYIKTYRLDWQHVSDLKKMDSKLRGLYNITWIPTYLLISPEGKVVAKSGNIEAIEQYLSRVL